MMPPTQITETHSSRAAAGTNNATQTRLGSWLRARWALVPLLLLGGMSLGLFVMISIALDDPGFSVEPEYYRQALDWDAERLRQQQSDALAWTLTWDFSREAARAEGTGSSASTPRKPIALRLIDRDGEPVAGGHITLTAFHNARAGQRQTVQFVEQSPGIYFVELELPRSGLWTLKLQALARGEVFKAGYDVELSTRSGHLLEARQPRHAAQGDAIR